MLRAQFIRSVFSDPMRTYVMTDTPGLKREDLNQVEIAINWTSENENNLNDTLKDSFIPAYRDGTVLIHGKWETRIEGGCDYKHYDNPQDFQSDYPDAKTAGVSDEYYDEIINHLSQPDATCRVEYIIHFVAQNGPEFSLCPFAKFIRHPLQQQDMAKLQLYGFTYREGKGTFESKAAIGYYDTDVADIVRKKYSDTYASDTMDNWDTRREALEGIGNTDVEAVHYHLAWLVYTDDVDNDGTQEKYLVLYELDKHKSLRIEPYGIRRNILSMVPLRLVRREGRLPGASILADCEPSFREINALHRHRSNQRRITDSVTLLMPNGVKDFVDLGSEYASFRPGMAMWLPDQYMNANMAPRQLTLQSTSHTNESVDEEQFIHSYVDILSGASSGASGKETQIDPRAPAAKTAMLLQRGDIRVEDLIEEWRRTVPDIIDLARALYFQNAGSDIMVVSKKGDGVVDQKIPLELIGDPRIKGVLKPIAPASAPEVEMQKYAALAMGAMQFVFPVKMKPDILIHLWNDYVGASRIKNPERFQIEMGKQGMTMGGQPADADKFNQAAQALQDNHMAARTGQPAAPQQQPINAPDFGALMAALNPMNGRRAS